jgi:tetratricopeptide (TPR) repeat protein
MSTRLDHLILKVKEDPLLLLDLGAAYLEVAASSDKTYIKVYHKRLSVLYQEYSTELPMAWALAGLIDGVANFYLTNFQQAKIDLNEALSRFKTGMPTDILGAIHWALGANFRSLGEIDLAVENQYIAAELISKNGLFKITYAYAFYQLGELHNSIGEYDSALVYYQEAHEVISKDKDKTASFRINNGLGICYLHLCDYGKSLEYLNIALSIKGISSAEKSRGLCDLGVVYFKKGDYSIAKKHLEESLKIRLDHNLDDASTTSLLNLGNVLIAEESYEKAVTVLDQALAIANKYNAEGKKIKIYKLLGQVNEKIGNDKLALEYFSLYDSLNSEVRSEQEHKIFRLKNKQIEKQRKQLEEKNVELKDTLDELAKVKNSRKSLFFSIGTAIILVILTEAFFDPLIDSYAYNVYLSLGVKIVIALLLKPMESFYERILFRKAMKLK